MLVAAPRYAKKGGVGEREGGSAASPDHACHFRLACFLRAHYLRAWPHRLIWWSLLNWPYIIKKTNRICYEKTTSVLASEEWKLKAWKNLTFEVIWILHEMKQKQKKKKKEWKKKKTGQKKRTNKQKNLIQQLWSILYKLHASISHTKLKTKINKFSKFTTFCRLIVTLNNQVFVVVVVVFGGDFSCPRK